MSPARLAVSGYAALWDAPDLSGDIVRRGAFAETLRARCGEPLPMFLQHRPEAVGAWRSVFEDARGLYVSGFVSGASERGREAILRLSRRQASGLSIGFVTRRATPRATRGRDLWEIDLWEVSVVSVPMQPAARVEWFEEESEAA